MAQEGEGKEFTRELSAETVRASEGSLTHAADLIAAAKSLQGSHPHLAYHLATLALEEVGRSHLLVMAEISGDRSNGHRRRSEDHVGKLFWALWGPTVARQPLSMEQIESFRGLARGINETRQRGIYYDPGQPPPRKAIGAAECTALVDLAGSRVELARAHGWRRLDEEMEVELSWLLEASARPEYRRLIFGASSMEKLAELGDVREWVRWMREQAEEADRVASELARAELERRPPRGEEQAEEPKWLLELRLQSASHSIRPKALNWWNGVSEWIKLFAVGSGNREMRVELTLPMRVSLDSLWYVGQGAANKLLLSLNIASRGLFWWELPAHTSRFYEKLTDLERSEQLEVSLAPKLEIDWGRKALNEQELKLATLCFGIIPGPDARSGHAPFDHYLNGLALLGKTDVFLQFELNSFARFYRAFREASRLYGRWDGEGDFSDRFATLLAEISGERADWSELLEAGEMIEAGREPEMRIDLSHVGLMKVATDTFLIQEFVRIHGEN